MARKWISVWRSLYFPLVAIAAALLLGASVIACLGFNVCTAYGNLFLGAFGGLYQISETLVKACPVIFTGLSYAIAKRCGLINLGAEGQLYIGALAGTIIATNLGGIPPAVHLPLAILAGFLGGGLYGLLAAELKVRFGASEIITTIMLNNIATSLVSYCVSGPLMDAGGNLPQSRPVLPDVAVPILLKNTRLHAGVILMAAALFAYYLFMWKTTAGYEMRVVGENESAGRYAGIPGTRVRLFSLFLAGGLAGIGGTLEILGVQFRLMGNFSPNYGFDGIAVALLGANSPIGIALSGILFGALRNGASRMEMMAGVPSAIIYMLQGFVILFVIGRTIFMRRDRGTKRRHPAKEAVQ